MRVRVCVRMLNVTHSTTGKVMDPDKNVLLCFQENFHDLPTAIYIDSQKLSPVGCNAASIPYYLVLEWGRTLGLLPGMGPSIRYTSFHITFVMGRAYS